MPTFQPSAAFSPLPTWAFSVRLDGACAHSRPPGYPGLTIIPYEIELPQARVSLCSVPSPPGAPPGSQPMTPGISELGRPFVWSDVLLGQKFRAAQRIHPYTQHSSIAYLPQVYFLEIKHCRSSWSLLRTPPQRWPLMQIWCVSFPFHFNSFTTYVWICKQFSVSCALQMYTDAIILQHDFPFNCLPLRPVHSDARGSGSADGWSGWDSGYCAVQEQPLHSIRKRWLQAAEADTLLNEARYENQV